MLNIDPDNHFHASIPTDTKYYSDEQFVRDVKSVSDLSFIHFNAQSIETKLGDLNSNNKALSDEVDALEQYSRRNCLLLHGVPESSKDTTEAAIVVFNSRLDLNINNEHIDRSHRLGQPRSDTDSDRPRPIIVKFTSYETRRRVFTAKWN